MKTKIAFFECKEEERVFFENSLNGVELSFFSGTINDALHVSEDFDAVSIFVHSKIDSDVLSKLPKLRYIQTRSTGYEHLLCREMYKKGFLLSNVSGYGGPGVGEFAFSLLLNATRHTNEAIERSKRKDFHYDDLKGTELFGKKLGILGLGTIGMRMARIGHGFGMEIMVFSRTHKPILDELGMRFVTLDALLKECDVLMIALPLTPDTKNLINKKAFSLMKQDTIIVNVARAEIIEDRVYRDCKSIFCLDVLADRQLVSKKNILYTPHMAYYTHEAQERILNISLKNIEAFVSGEELPNCLYLECQRNYKEK